MWNIDALDIIYGNDEHRSKMIDIYMKKGVNIEDIFITIFDNIIQIYHDKFSLLDGLIILLQAGMGADGVEKLTEQTRIELERFNQNKINILSFLTNNYDLDYNYIIVNGNNEVKQFICKLTSDQV